MMVAANAYSVLAERHGYPESERYLRILEFLMTPQQAQIAAELPSPVEEVAARLNLPVKTVKEEIATLFRKGVVFPKNFQTLEFPRFARSVMQLHDASQSIMNLGLYDKETEKELFALWEEFLEEEYYTRFISPYARSTTPSLRVVPAYRAIKDLPDIQPWEDMREIVRAQELHSVVSCSCRVRRAGVGKTCEHSHDINCLQFNRSAEYSIERGHGRKLSYDELIELIDEIEEDGLVHNMRNDRNLKMNTLCSCCIDCCILWHPLDTQGVNIGKVWSKSRFQAEIDKDLCNGCQVCVVERCMFDAIEMVKVPGSKMLKAQVIPEKCFGCGACVLKCAPNAITMKTVRPVEHVPQMLAPARAAG